MTAVSSPEGENGSWLGASSGEFRCGEVRGPATPQGSAAAADGTDPAEKSIQLSNSEGAVRAPQHPGDQRQQQTEQTRQKGPYKVHLTLRCGSGFRFRAGQKQIQVKNFVQGFNTTIR